MKGSGIIDSPIGRSILRSSPIGRLRSKLPFLFWRPARRRPASDIAVALVDKLDGLFFPIVQYVADLVAYLRHDLPHQHR